MVGGKKGDERELGYEKKAYSNIRLSAKGTGFREPVEEQVGKACVDLFAIAQYVFALAHCAERDGGLKWVRRLESGWGVRESSGYLVL